MKKKSLFILLLLMLSVCLHITVCAAEDNGSNERSFLESIGITFEFKSGERDFITRGEFIASAVQLLHAEDMSGSELPFSDVSSEKYYCSPVDYALKNGFISSAEMFYPEREITYSEAYRIAVSMLGRDLYAKRSGGYPTGYLLEASKSGISRGIVNTGDEKLTEADFYKLLKNLCEADLLTVESIDSDGNTGYYDSSTILKEYFDIECIEGIVTADGRTGIYEKNGAVSRGYVKIGEDTYQCPTEAPLGCNVKAYVRDESIVYLYEYKNETYKIQLEDIDSAEKRRVTYNEGSGSKHLDISVPSAIIINGMADASAKLSDFLEKDGYVLFTDNNSDGSIDTIAVWQTQMLYVGAVAGDKIYDKNGAFSVDCDDKNEIIVNGVRVKNISDYIKKSMLLSVCASPDKKFYKIEICRNSAEGTVTAFNRDEKEIYIDGECYAYNGYFEKYDLSSVKLGMKVKVMLDTNGAVTCKSYAADTEMLYGYLIKAAREKGIKSKIEVKLFAEDGEETVYELADKVKFDSEKMPEAQVYAALCPGTETKMQLIRYSLNDEGQIKVIDTKAADGGVLLGGEDSENRLIQYKFPTAGMHDTIYYIPETGIVHPYFNVTNGTKILNIGLADTSCVMRDKTWLSENKQITVSDMEVYDVTSAGDAGVILLFNRAAVGAEVSEGSESGVIYSVNPAVSPDGDDGYRIIVYKDSEYRDLYVTDEKVLEEFKTADGSVMLKRGDYIRYDREASGDITSLKRDFEFDGEKVNVEFSNQLYFTYYYGKLFDSSGSIATMMPENIDGLVSGDGIGDARYTIKLPDEITVFDSEQRLIYSISADEIVTYTQSGLGCDKALVKAKDGNIHDVVIYR